MKFGGYGALVLTFVLPQFEPVFEGNEDKLPMLTKIVMAMGDFFSNYGWVAGLALLGFLLWVVWVMHNPTMKLIALRQLCNMPGVRRWLITRHTAVCRRQRDGS